MWFIKKKKGKGGLEDPVNIQDRLAIRLAGFALKVQTLFAEKMNRLLLKVPPHQMKQMLIAFCMATCLFSAFLIVDALRDKHKKSFEVEQSKTPRFFDRTGEESFSDGIIVDEESFFKVQVFRKYMDSLKVHNTTSYDSIVLTRPGLMDSIAILESFYYSQKIK
jgi:hypothetical protein